jgi:acyl-CoA synthetase (AMP-forming)/AMP-acid ligase II
MSGARPLATLLCKPPERHALAFGHRGARDWQRLVDEVMVLATSLRRRGGGAWLIASDDAYEVALGLLATLHAGGVALLPASLQPGHLSETGADGLLADQAPFGWRLPVLALRDLDLDAERLPLAPLDVERAEVRLHTSGTTGAPVAVRKPLRCLDAEVSALDRLFARPAAGAVLATVPPYHIYGLLFRVLWPLAAGRGMARDTIRFPGELLAAAREVPGALLVSSPAFLKRALPVLDLAEVGRHLGGVFSSGGPLPAEVAAAYNRNLVQPVVEVYGSTETGGIGWRSVLDAAAPPPWAPLPGVRLTTDEESGVLMVASPFLPAPGWHRTGDGAALLADGRFELRGRVDRIVKIEERRISLTEVEQWLGERPEVAAARVLLLAARPGGRPALGAVVVPSEAGWQRLRAGGKEALRGALLEPLRPHLDSAALPRRWRFVRRLPEGAQGKTSVAALAALFEASPDERRPNVLACTECADGTRLSLHLPPDLWCFEGHFEGAPILAGVVQVDWAMRLAEERFGLVPQVLRIEALKFFEVIPAEARVDLELGYDADAGRLWFSYGAGERVCSSGRIQLRAAS